MGKNDCIVVGGGIIGMATARELALRGLRVSLFDKGKLGMESSWAAGGILSPMRPWSENPGSFELSHQGKACYAGFISELKQQTGIDPEYYCSGLLMISQDDVGKTLQWAKSHEILFDEDYKKYPVNMRIPAKSIFLAEIAQVRVPRLLKALHASLLDLQVNIFENAELADLDNTQNNTQGILQSVTISGKKHYADNFIITAGAWTEKLLKKNDAQIEIEPVLGQMLCLKFPEQRFEMMVLDGGHYFIPRKDGHILIGSTMEHVGFNKETSETAKNELMAWARELWPDISEAKFIKHWSGLRPATENGKPYIGQLENYDNVYINAGHFRKGILQAPVCARMISEMIC